MYEQYSLFDQPKRCTKCGEIKPLSEFYKHKRMKDGLTSECKPCCKARTRRNQEKDPERHRKRNRLHYENNKEAYIQRARAWAKANPEKRAEQHKLYRKRHPERVKARDLRWKHANPDKVREYNRRVRAKLGPEKRRKYNQRYYRKNREKVVRSNKRWYAANREKVCRTRLNYLARKRGAQGNGATLSELKEIHGSLCYLCELVEATVVEHVVPLSRGGTNYPENLKPACAPCNHKKGNKLIEELSTREDVKK